ncbi:MAG TPA: methyltransferase domain-containing protein [Baekduia sp.]|nr:methyltransferase domain-containing protein [Baekduia sp.]
MPDLQAAIASNPAWYHSIELAPGVVTPGRVDLRKVAGRILPGDLTGQRVLDVGTFDGFWAFEHEKRGARVVAIDVEQLDAADWPPIHRARLQQAAREMDIELGRGFHIAKEALGSQVERVPCSVYDVTPDRVGGMVDRAFIGALLLHLRDPVGALEAVRGTLRPGGTLQVLEPIDVKLTLRHPRKPRAGFEVLSSEFTWWYPNLRALRGWLESAGFTGVRDRHISRPPGRMGMGGIVYAALTCTSPS